MSQVIELLDEPLIPIIEAALFAADQPLSISDIRGLFIEGGEPSKEQIQAAIDYLESQCDSRGVELVKVASGYRYRTKEKYATWVGRMFAKRPPRLSRAALETLAIIAYRQPVTRGDIEEIRGVAVSSETIRGLVDREWVRELGHRDTPGRPSLFGTSRQFLDFFGLTSLRELPVLDDRRELEDIAKEMNIQLWPEEDESAANDDNDSKVDETKDSIDEASEAESHVNNDSDTADNRIDDEENGISD